MDNLKLEILKAALTGVIAQNQAFSDESVANRALEITEAVCKRLVELEKKEKPKKKR